MKLKLIIKIVVLIAAAILAYKLKSVIAGVILGGALSIVYFSITGSVLNWKIKK